MSSDDHPPATPVRILLVEDARPMQEMLATMLREMHHLQLVGVAETAGEAIDKFNELQPHAVILDLGLREGTGFDVLHAINRRPLDCQVLVFTSYDTEPYRLRCVEAGANGFFSKIRQHRELMHELSRLGNHPRASRPPCDRDPPTAKPNNPL